MSGIPVLKEDKAEKFVTLFKTKLLAARNIGDKNGLVDLSVGMENGVGNQTLYLTYASITDAKNAFNKLNNLKFDKDHKMSCIWANELRNIIEEEQEQTTGVDFKEPIFGSDK